MKTSIATVSISGDLGEKLAAISVSTLSVEDPYGSRRVSFRQNLTMWFP